MIEHSATRLRRHAVRGILTGQSVVCHEYADRDAPPRCPSRQADALSPGRGRDARAAFLRAAAAVFSERGFQDASVEDIAHRAGYSKGAIYWHFESKDDLFLALLEEPGLALPATEETQERPRFRGLSL